MRGKLVTGLNILVTGDRGYLGSILVPRLLASGHAVSGIDQEYYAGCSYGAFDPVSRSVKKDIRDLEASDLEGFDAVIHLAALSNDPLGDIDPNLTFEINCQASIRLAELAKTSGVKRFVMSSSCSTYGLSQIAQIDEQSAVNPLTPYGRSKVDAEIGIRRLADDQFSPVLLRHATVYGVTPMLRFDLAINNLVAHAITTGRVLLKSDGLAWRPFVHADDVGQACAVAATADSDAVHDQVFNIGRTEDNYRILDIAQMVVEAVPGSELVFAEGASADLRSYRVSFEKARSDLPGFSPAWTVQAGIKQLISRFERIGLRSGDFEGARYNRVARISDLLDRGHLTSSLRWKNAHPDLASPEWI
ncbi:NAD-dependent epimerase/dehydratase family protein [Maricaulis sp. CAU 1757]